METKINIAEILKDKPQGTKLYSSACGKCELKEADDKSFKISFYTKFGFMNSGEEYLDKNGKLYDDGECVVFPSRKMRDWSKFTWKKGDVLVHKDGDVYITFERFVDDTYCSFAGKYYLWKENNNTEQFYEKERLLTSDFQKADKETAQTYINTVEERLGGKLNRETLEIEKPQPEFKDGDIVRCINGTIVLIKEISFSQKVYFHAYMVNGKIYFQERKSEYYCYKDNIKRVATEEEKQQLFDALAKEGKAWDAEKKQIVDLKPKVELKPFDKVLVRDNSKQKWIPDMYRFYDKDEEFPYNCFSSTYKRCIPYNEDTKHLLGTTDEWKGGEG